MLGLRCDEIVHDREGMVRVHGRLALVALDQTDAESPEDVDGGNDHHCTHGAMWPDSTKCARMAAATTGKTTKCARMAAWTAFLAVIGELKGNRDVLGFAQRLDHELEAVLVFSHNAQLVALDPHLDLRRHSLDSLAKVARDVVGDPRVQQDLDLAATFADRFRIAGLEKFG